MNPKLYAHALKGVVALITGLSPFTANLNGAVVEDIGPPTQDQVVAATVAPTRSDEPFMATAGKVFQWNADQAVWQDLYAPPWTTARIKAIGSYEKSSKVLYVVHTAGVSHTGDGGESWSEAVPPGWDGTSSSYSVQVDPNERRHAVVATEQSAWETTDFGTTFDRLPVDAGLGSVIGVAFLPGDGEPRLVLAQGHGLTLFAGDPLLRVASLNSAQSLTGMQTHPSEPLVFLQTAEDQWQLLNLQEGATAEIQTFPARVPGRLGKPLPTGSSSIWVARGNSVVLVSLSTTGEPPFEVANFTQQPEFLLPHPRQQDSIYVVTGNQLQVVRDCFAGASPTFIQPADLSKFSPVQWQQESIARTVEENEGPTEQPMDAAILLNKVMADEPGFQQTLGLVLDNEQANPGQFAEWIKKARQRHWLPEFKVLGGVRQYGLTDNLLVTSTDSFGFEQLEDYRLPDKLRNLAYFGIVLEWPLGELAYDDEMVDISKERRYYFQERRELIENLGEIYYGRIKNILAVQGFMGEPTQARKIQLLLEIHQMSELLNGFCGINLFDPTPLD